MSPQPSPTAGLSFNLLALLFLAHISIPKAQAHTRKFFSMSYYNPASGKYGIGIDDASLVFFCVVVLTGLRASAMEYLLSRVGKWVGLTKRKELTRFTEQAWLLTYYLVVLPLGMVSPTLFVPKLKGLGIGEVARPKLTRHAHSTFTSTPSIT